MEKNSAAILGCFIGRWASVLASKSRSPRVRFGGKSPGRVLLAHGERRGTSAAQWGPHVSGKEEGRNGPSDQTERGEGVRVCALANWAARLRGNWAGGNSWAARAAGKNNQALAGPRSFLFFFLQISFLFSFSKTISKRLFE